MWKRIWQWCRDTYVPSYFDLKWYWQLLLFLPFWGSLFLIYVVWILKMIEGYGSR